jgi:trigger factor
MNVASNEIEGLRQQVSFTFDQNELQKKYQNELRLLQGKVSVPGFRKGKIPFKVLQQRYGRSVLANLEQGYISQAWGHILQELKLVPMSEPQLNMDKPIHIKRDFVFDFTFEVVPEFQLIDGQSLSFEKIEWSISEERLAEEVQDLRNSMGEWTDLEGRTESRIGDQVVFSLQGYQGEEELTELHTPEESVELGQKQLIPALEEAMVGLEIDADFTADYEFPADHNTESLANKSITFKGKVTKIQEKQPLSMEDVLEKMAVDDIDALHDQIKVQVEESYQRKEQSELREEALRQIRESLDFPVPTSALEDQVNRRLHHNHDHDHSGDCSHESTAEEEENARTLAAQDIRLEAFVQRFSQRNQLEISDQEMTAHILEIMKATGNFGMQLFELYREPKNRERLKASLLEDKAMDQLIENAQVVVKQQKVPTLAEEEEESQVQEAAIKTEEG